MRREPAASCTMGGDRCRGDERQSSVEGRSEARLGQVLRDEDRLDCRRARRGRRGRRLGVHRHGAAGGGIARGSESGGGAAFAGVARRAPRRARQRGRRLDVRPRRRAPRGQGGRIARTKSQFDERNLLLETAFFDASDRTTSMAPMERSTRTTRAARRPERPRWMLDDTPPTARRGPTATQRPRIRSPSALPHVRSRLTVSPVWGGFFESTVRGCCAITGHPWPTMS